MVNREPYVFADCYGRDEVALGIPHGERVGALLSAVERWRQADDCAADLR